ncbi:MAG TPA: hypothetical protein VFG20_01665, partial [Planctomycetaceae bacterium]|nr:hypothetical protein [Planctomycetaceae bacterium]
AIVESQPEFVLLSSLAPGTDQLVSERAVQANFKLATILPGSLEAYAAVLGPKAAAGLLRFATPQFSPWQLELDEVLPVGNDPASEEIRQRAYKVAGHVVLQNADFLLVIYDDDPARPTYSGGTAEMIRRAKDAGIPTIWIHPRTGDVQIGSDKQHRLTYDQRERIPEAVAAIVRNELSLIPEELPAAPQHHSPGKPPSQKELQALREFFDEQPLGERHGLWKFLGVTWNCVDAWHSEPRPKRRSPAFDRAARVARLEMDQEVHAVEAVLGQHRDWLDQLSIHYAGLHRASVLLIFVLGMLAVLFAGCAGLPHAEHTDVGHHDDAADELIFGVMSRGAFFCSLELLCLFSGLWLFWLNRSGRWHERSTDYRLLTERLRHAAALSVLGRAMWQYAYEPLPAHYSQYNPRSGWVDRLYRALVRQAVFPLGRRNLAENRRAYIRACRRYLVRNYVGGQAIYHRRNAAKLHRQEHVLEFVAYTALAMTFLLCLAHFFVHSPWLTVMATTLPAIVAACHGLTAHFHLQRLMQRSEAMERYLQAQFDIAPRLIPGKSSHALAEWVEAPATRMLQEADDWRVVFRLLNVPTPG